MDNSNKSTPIEQDDVLIGKIKLLAGKTETDPNPEELESLKKLIKKNVPRCSVTSTGSPRRA